MRPLVARCRLGLASLRQGSGAAGGDARAARDAAAEALRELGMTHWLGRPDPPAVRASTT
jgi:hypothetical protein